MIFVSSLRNNRKEIQATITTFCFVDFFSEYDDMFAILWRLREYLQGMSIDPKPYWPVSLWRLRISGWGLNWVIDINSD